MATKEQNGNVDRRGFLKAAVATAVAATATGAGAALVTNNASTQTAVLATPIPQAPVVQSAQNILAAHNDTADLLSRLASAQAENMRLQASLDAAQRQLGSLQTANVDSNAASEALSVELATATEQIGVLSGLVALYEQLDEVDVAATLDQGLTAVSETIGDLVDNTPLLRSSIETGQEVIDEIEAHIPTLEDGRLWLDEHLGQVQGFYNGVQVLLENIVESVGPFLDMLNQWFADVRKWLPFRMGERAAEVMVALTTLVSETPNTVNGVQQNVAQPLDIWLGKANEEAPLQRKLVKPMRDNLFAEASNTILRAEQVKTSYQGNLAEPMETAVTSQKIIRDLITSYREQHQV
ncbi:MAG: twin-arginine translocation signal domain-containing protein [Chloroflexota bacterium]